MADDGTCPDSPVAPRPMVCAGVASISYIRGRRPDKRLHGSAGGRLPAKRQYQDNGRSCLVVGDDLGGEIMVCYKACDSMG